jgi:hypothetical protein
VEGSTHTGKTRTQKDTWRVYRSIKLSGSNRRIRTGAELGQQDGTLSWSSSPKEIIIIIIKVRAKQIA